MKPDPHMMTKPPHPKVRRLLCMGESIQLQPLHTLTGDLIDRHFQFLCGIFQFLSDLDTLGAVLLALAAADTVGSGGRCFSGCGTHKVLLQCTEGTLGVFPVIGSKGVSVKSVCDLDQQALPGGSHSGKLIEKMLRL